MCFSATASFTASATLAVVGTATVLKVRDKKNLIIAVVPLLFAFQQFCEGIVWSTLYNPDLAWLNQIAKYSFLFFACSVWPIISPLGLYKFEKLASRKKYLKMCVFIGCIVSSWLLFHLVAGSPTVEFKGNLFYYMDLMYRLPTRILYLIAVTVPAFISSDKNIKMFRGLSFLSFVAADFFYHWCAVSVWCFFAALLSVRCYCIIVNDNKLEQLSA